jgi:putative protease
MQLLCPAGNLPSLKAAVDNGADAVYLGFKDDTNARHFAGLNFTDQRVLEGIEYARRRGVRVLCAINTYPQANGWPRWQAAVDRAAALEVDALIVADIGVMDYACRRWPELRLHLSVQASATSHEAIRFYHQQFGIRRAVLPRVLALPQVRRLVERSEVEIEVFGFGSLCVMVEGRCMLSSYVTGQSPNTFGACSPGSFVRWETTGQGLESRLNGVLIDRYSEQENAAYPTICKGRYDDGIQPRVYALEQPTSLNTLELLPELVTAGVAGVKIEGRQRSPAYVAQVTRVWRAAIDACLRNPARFAPSPEWLRELARLSEGAQTTLGAYQRAWQ